MQHAGFNKTPVPPSDASSLATGGASPAPQPVNAKQVITVHLQNIPLLSGLDPQALSKLGSFMQFRTYTRGSYVLHKGSAGDHLLFLLSGRLQVFDLTEDGREIGISFLVPGDYFDELSIVDGLPCSASVIASEASLVGFLPRTQVLNLIYSSSVVAERVLKRMAAKIRLAAEQRAILSIGNAFQRVFALLFQMSKMAPGGLVVIDNMPTQQEFAIMANTSRETVSRALQVLLQKGIVERDARRLIVRQPDALKKLSLDSQPSSSGGI